MANAQTLTISTPAPTAKNEFKRITLNGERYDIFISGDITSDAAERLQLFVAQHQIEFARVYLDSPGGSLIGGIRLGEVIRELGFETGIRAAKYDYSKGPKAICASSCAYAFAGGVHRFFRPDEGALGVHQFNLVNDDDISTSDTQRISAYILSYLRVMGVDATAFELASNTNSVDMRWLSVAEAEKIRLADNGVSPPTTEIKLSNGWPYLKIEQVFTDVTARALLLCVDGEFSLMAGIVTTPEKSREQVQFFGLSFLMFDDEQYMAMSNSEGHAVEGNVIWLDRSLDNRGLELLQSSETLGIWLNNGGPMMWGVQMDLGKIQTEVRSFLSNCPR